MVTVPAGARGTDTAVELWLELLPPPHAVITTVAAMAAMVMPTGFFRIAIVSLLPGR